MKTTLELPDELMRKVKIRAAQDDRRLKDVVADLLERGLEASNAPQGTGDPLQAWMRKLEIREDGTVLNPNGLDDPGFVATLEELRERNRRQEPRDPFAEAD